MTDNPISPPPPSRSAPLAPFAGARPPAPAWFNDVLAVDHVDGETVVEGASIRWRRWGDVAKPGMVFVHGGVAHLGWWDFIAPFFVDRYCAVALSLSGMGGSDERESYTLTQYADEVMAVAKAAGLAPKPIYVGHSFGGFVGVQAAHRHGTDLAGAVIIDSPIRAKQERPTQPPRRRGGRVYGSEAEILARFRLLPDQDCENLFLIDHIARGALRRAPDGEGGEGWSWRHDPDLWPKMVYPDAAPGAVAAELGCPVAFLRGARSGLMSDEIWAGMRVLFPEGSPMIDVPDADHHVLLDQPLALVSALNGLLSAWPRR